MNQEMQNQLTQLVSQLNSAVFFAQGQLPDIINQLLTYHLYDSLLWLVFSLALLIPYLCKLIHDLRRKNPNVDPDMCASERFKQYNWVWDMENDMHGVCVMHFIVVCLLIIVFMCHAEQLLKILVAPKLFVLDYIRSIA